MAQGADVQRERERALRFGLALDAAPVGMYLVSARPGRVGEVLEVNPAMCALMGRAEADLRGCDTHDVLLAERVEDGLILQRRLLSGQIASADRVERRIVHADGHDVWVELSIALSRDEAGEPDCFVVTQVVDVTAHRQERRDAGRRIERDRQIAAVLRESLLPDVPRRIGRAEVAARYAPAAGEPVGGDWLDVCSLPDGRIGLTVGDVAGHGLGSASTMSRLRHALRALANTGAGPAEVVSRLNRAMHLDEMLASTDIEIATVVHAQYDPGDGVLRHCSAGHLPMLCVDPGGGPGEARDAGVRLLPAGSGPPLGVVPDVEYTEHVEYLTPGCTLVGYTDGLVERRDRDLSEALADLLGGLRARLRTHLAPMDPAVGRRDVEGLADAVLAAAPPGRREDDTAVVVLALPLPRSLPVTETLPRAVVGARPASGRTPVPRG
jgi:PAS domain S-box-containing protein